MDAGKNLNISLLAVKITKCKTKTPNGASKSPICQGRIASKDTP